MVAARRPGNVGKKKGATVRDVPAAKFVKGLAAQLKREGKLMVPNIAEFAKTSHGRERAPQNDDWYYTRCAAVLRRVYLRPAGLGGLSKPFGNKKNKGCLPEATIRAATGPLHWACKSLEQLKLLAKGKKSGRIVTREGQRRADTVAFNVKIHRRQLAGKKAAKKN